MPTKYIQAGPSPIMLDATSLIPPNVAAIGVDTDTNQLVYNVDGTIRYAATSQSMTTTLTTTRTVTAAESGRTFFLNATTGFVSTLPAPAAGLRYTFINILANTSGNHTVVTNGSSNIIKGNQNSVAGDAGDSGTGDDTVNFVANASLAGDKLDLYSDGTSWFAYAISRVAAGMTFTTAS